MLALPPLLTLATLVPMTKLSALAFVLAITTTAPAQAPTPLALAQQAHGLMKQIGELEDVEEPSDEQKAQLAQKQKDLAQFVAMCVKGDGFGEQHFVEASSPFIEARPEEGLAISEAGVAKFPESRFLLDHVGFAQSGMAFAMRASAAQLARLRAAEAAFRKALKCKPDTHHAHIGLYQVLDHLGECDEALRELDTTLKHPEGAASLNLTWLRRASLLIRSGKAKDATAVLKEAAADDDDKMDLQIMRLRAAAIAKDVAGIEAAAKELRAIADSPRTLVEIADALAFAGKKDDALKLLAKRPARSKFETEEERIAQQHLQSAEALELVLKTTDWGVKGPTRVALTKALGHTFTVVDSSAKPPKLDLSSSPLAMASLLVNKPVTAPKDWGNRILLVLCLRAMAGYEPGKLEKVALGAQRVQPDAEDVAALLVDARFAVGDTEQTGVLTGMRVLEQLAGTAAPAKK